MNINQRTIFIYLIKQALYPTSIIVLVYVCTRSPERRSTLSMVELSFINLEGGEENETAIDGRHSLGASLPGEM
jgi:hypothetical protein